MENWEFNKLKINNYNNPQSGLYKYFEFIKNNFNKLDGDIFEFGVYKGKSLLSTALLLKSLNCNKKIYAFDAYFGLKPFVDSNDNFNNFYMMYEEKVIDENHLKNIEKIKKINNFLSKKNDTLTISDSNDFSDTSLESLKKKIEFLELDNIVFVKGYFSDTIKNFKNPKIFCSNIDCDLYKSYEISLPFVYQNLVDGGFIHLDEYYSLKFPGARLFCNKFCKDNKIKINKYFDSIDNWERNYIIKKTY
jgi:hypothetical protein